MSTEKSATAVEESERGDELFGHLPEEVCGWERYSRNPGETLFEYWKKGSTHIVGAYEQIVAKQLREGDIRVTKRTYDQFNHLLNTRNLIEKSPEDTRRLWRTAKERMNEFPSNEPFDNPPKMPEAIGKWELVSERHEKPLEMTTWERPFGTAELTVEQVNVIAHYSHTKRPHQIRYREPDTDAENVVDDVPRTSAFEIARNSLNALSAPVIEMTHQQEALESVKGIGPAKSRQLLLLGITTPTDLKTHLETESPQVALLIGRQRRGRTVKQRFRTSIV
jgi:predicted flap endonuclease-1-like 5' DNA nuclease